MAVLTAKAKSIKSTKSECDSGYSQRSTHWIWWSAVIISIYNTILL